MEHLPDELWLAVFEYLHHVDILQAFSRVNYRFHRLVHPYAHHIDLSPATFAQYDRFCREILPRHSSSIHSLKLKTNDQFRLFKPYILQLTTSLRSLTLDTDDFFPRARHDDDALFYLQHLKDFPKLRNFQLIGLCNSITYPNLFAYASQVPTLQTLTILTEPNSTVTPHKIQPDIPCIDHMRCLQIVKIHLIDFSDLIYLLQHARQITQVFLSVCHIDYPRHLFEPQASERRSTLQKLHLELAVTYTKRLLHCKFAELVEFIAELFRQFHIKLQSFALILSIVTSRSNTYFTDLNALQYFASIPSFQYLIHTNDPPAFAGVFENNEQLPDGTHMLYSARRPVSFIDARYPSYYSDLRIVGHTSWMSMCNAYDLSISCAPLPDVSFSFKFFKLRKLTGYCLSDSTTRDLLRTVAALSPNLRSLKLCSNTSDELCETLQVCRQSLRKVTSLECDHYALYATFFADIAKVLPRLKHLKLHGVDLSCTFSPERMVEQIERHCGHLMTLHWINLKHNRVSGEEEEQSYEKFIAALAEKQKRNRIFFSTGIFFSYGDCTDVWF